MKPMVADRRSVLKAVAIAAPAAYLLSFRLDAATTPGDGLGSAFLRIEPDDRIVLTSPLAEIGQGSSTALAMVLGDALDCEWDRIRIELATAGEEFVNPKLHAQLTGASTGMSAFHDPFQKAGAAARTMLMQAAARRWSVPLTSLRTEAGQVFGPKPGQVLRYGELSKAAGRLPVPTSLAPPPKRTEPFVRSGKTRLDIASKVDGTAMFAVDLVLPDMLHVAIRTAPVFGGTLRRLDVKPALGLQGVRGVVPLPNGVAVVADRWWTARRAADLLEPVWSPTPNDGVDDGAISRQFQQALASEAGAVVDQRGDIGKGLADADARIERRYEVPFLAHATMEPMSCSAQIAGGECHVWTGSQHPGKALTAAAQASGLPESAVRYHAMLAGGGFGRRQESDMVTQAVTVAKAFPGAPVKLIWSREEDVAHDFYRPAGISVLKAGFTGDRFEAYSHRQVTQSILPRMYPSFMKAFDEVAANVIFSPYQMPHMEARWIRSETHVPSGMWRSVGASHTVFAIESFIDEVAHEMGTDPYQLRRRLLSHSPPALAVLDRLTSLCGWSGARASGSAIGIAISHKGDDCLTAQAAEVSIKDGILTVSRIWTVADPGRAINPDAVVAQLEGAALWGLSAALWGKISIVGGAVRESNYHDYRVVRLAETPEMITELLEGGGEMTGAGEGGAAGVAPAVCNAIFRLTGKRIRTLPIQTQFA